MTVIKFVHHHQFLVETSWAVARVRAQMARWARAGDRKAIASPFFFGDRPGGVTLNS